MLRTVKMPCATIVPSGETYRNPVNITGINANSLVYSRHIYRVSQISVQTLMGQVPGVMLSKKSFRRGCKIHPFRDMRVSKPGDLTQTQHQSKPHISESTISMSSKPRPYDS